MARSIRASWMAWNAALLALVLLAFGALLHQRVQAATYGAVDAELEGRARALAGALEHDADDGWELELSEDYLRGLAAEARFAIWAPDGTVLRDSGLAAERPWSGPGLRTRGELREAGLVAPGGARVLVARSLRAERAALGRLRAALVGAGLAVLALGLCGSWQLARRALRPVDALSRSAAAIDASAPGRRLDARGAPRELLGLARAFDCALERLAEALERQKRFTADASHELRTPLAIVRTQIDQALRGPRTSEEYRACLSACSRAAVRMSELVEGLLVLARADAEGALRRERLDLAELVEESVELLRPAARAAGVELRHELAAAPLHGDRRLLADAVANLIDNAVRYNRPGGRVDVRLARSDGTAELRVADTGVGIPPQARAHLFERFQRADAARARAAGGHGLGLAIVRRSVELHGGRVELESEAGRGSTFTVRLPCDGEPAS